jgi:hypothetical protein
MAPQLMAAHGPAALARGTHELRWHGAGTAHGPTSNEPAQLMCVGSFAPHGPTSKHQIAHHRASYIAVAANQQGRPGCGWSQSPMPGPTSKHQIKDHFGPRQPTGAARMRLDADAWPHQIKDQIGRCPAPPDQGSNRPMPGPTRSRIK